MANQNKVYRVADYLLNRLADLGIEDIFFLPGGGAMYLNDALACETRITPIPCHHEQACGIAAEAYGRIHGSGFGVAMVTTGPGATNVLTPVAGAWIESLPLFILSGQVKRPDALRGRQLRQSGVQEVDVVSMVKPVTKYAVTVDSPENVRKCFEEAIWHMQHGRPGPVWLDVPLDVQAAPINPDDLIGFDPPEDDACPDLSTELKALEKLLSNSKRPLILAGHGVRISGAAKKFQELVENLGIPCVFTWNASDLLAWDNPLYIGRPGVVAARSPNFAVQNCDCLISIGCRLDNVITAYNPKGFARNAKKVVVDVDQNELDRHELKIELPILSDANHFIGSWLNNAKHPLPEWADWRAQCLDWKKRYTPLDGRKFGTDGPMSHYEFVETLSNAIPKNQLVITGSSGLAVEVFYTAFRNKVGQRMFLTSGLGSMGYGIAAAIGACVGAGRSPTVCVESDGSLMLNLQELATLKALDLPITVVVMNNGGYASIRNTQRNYFEERYLGTGPASGLFIPDFVKVAKGMELPAQDVNLPNQLAAAFDSAGPRLLNVHLKMDEVLSPKVAAMPQPDGSIISMPLEDMSPLLSLEQLEKEMHHGVEDRSRLVRS
ncbi:thiamine pyrophosphate-binding protein [Polynucleobacter paneuropaeus]|uniref:thiamine pyrophosphate-binding protein n=1 Tax=Polynucleobacter paneuropaeus TaxID=2527775 RepID=UPI000DBF08EB|nr:thiamine pyrophosphate-binding protein [Polynucleobacter paneuropaeus]AWW45652.1 thiamine pyrophosphate-binding protein [Polynucleobacter paneuropaeus]